MRKFTLLLAFLLFAGVQVVLAQIEVKGTVTDAKTGTLLPGVSILVKGTLSGTVTDADGKYSLPVPAGYNELIFSFIGMRVKEVKIDGRAVVDVAMEEDVVGLDEVVVTALGISREKKSLGYSTQEATGLELTRTADPDFQTSLSGRFAGVEVRQSSGMPGSPAQIFIRGGRAFSGNNAPLYVVDGLPISSNPDYEQNVTGAYYTNRALDIDPNSIESITVLKGQAAAALYGLRASNGVILITTKKGKVGNVGKAVTVSLNSNFSTEFASKLPDRQNTYGQGYYDDNGVWTFYPAFSYSWGPKITDLPNDPTYGGNNYEGHSGEFFDPYKGMWTTPTGYDNPKYFYDQNGQTWNNNISINGVSKDASYAIGFSATNQNGIIPETGMDRYNANASATYNLSPKWKAGFSGNYSNVKLEKLPSGNSSWLFTVYGAPPSFDLMGTPYHEDGVNGPYRQISYRRGAVGENPNWALVNNYFHEKTNRFFGNIFLEYKPFDWLTVREQIGVDTYGTTNEDLYQMGSTGTGQALPTASQYPTPDNPTYGYREPTGGSINIYGINRTYMNNLFTMTFTKRWDNGFGGTFVYGNEYFDNRSEYWNMYGTGFTTPGWNNLANTNTQTNSEQKYWNRTVGNFGNLMLDWKSMIFLQLTGRFDKTSQMPTSNNMFFYPSVSLGWVFTELNALQGNKTLSFGKLRLSYARVGQAGQYIPQVYVQGGAASGFLDDGIQYPLQGISGYKVSNTIYDPNMQPQNTTTWEVGTEIKLFNNRLGFDYTWSKQIAEEQIFGVPMAGSTGFAIFWTNGGQMNSTANELIVNGTPVKMDNFTWDLFLTFTKVYNECIALAPGVESIFLGGYETPNIRASAGDTYPAIYGNRFARDDQGRILVDEDPNSYYYGMPYQGDFGKIGEVTPDFLMGLTSNMTIMKNLTFSFRFDWKQGGDMYSGSNRLMNLYGTSAVTEDRETPYVFNKANGFRWDGYLSNGEPTNIQRGGPDDPYAYPDLYNDVFGNIEEASVWETSFIKLREISLSYAFPTKVTKKLKIQGLSLTAFTRNILIWTTLPNFDPEASQGQGNMQGGMDYMSLPQTTSVGIGLNITF